jgi:hypothetical protein
MPGSHYSYINRSSVVEMSARLTPEELGLGPASRLYRDRIQPVTGLAFITAMESRCEI